MEGDHNDTLSVTIRSALSDDGFDAQIPRTMTVNTLKTRAAKELGRALFNQAAEPIILAVRHEQTGTRLQEERTLGSYNINEGDTLVLYEESAAGMQRFKHMK